MASAPKRWALFLTCAVTVFVADQVSKNWAVETLGSGEIIDLFWTLRFRYIQNFGISFGMGQQLGRIVGVAVIAVLAAVTYFVRKIHSPLVLVLLGLLSGGAAGNLADRIIRAEDGFMSGGVVDFIDFQWFPIFNIADTAVVCSAIVLAGISYFDETLLTLSEETEAAGDTGSDAGAASEAAGDAGVESETGAEAVGDAGSEGEEDVCEEVCDV